MLSISFKLISMEYLKFYYNTQSHTHIFQMHVHRSLPIIYFVCSFLFPSKCFLTKIEVTLGECLYFWPTSISFANFSIVKIFCEFIQLEIFGMCFGIIHISFEDYSFHALANCSNIHWNFYNYFCCRYLSYCHQIPSVLNPHLLWYMLSHWHWPMRIWATMNFLTTAERKPFEHPINLNA